MDRRAESDNHARKEQRGRAAAKNVSAKFSFRFHRYNSLLRREPSSRLTLQEEGQVELLGRRLTHLVRVQACRKFQHSVNKKCRASSYIVAPRPDKLQFQFQ